MPSILAIGSLSYDLFFTLPRLPLPGETLPTKEMTAFAGGKTANQAVAAARMGALVAMAGLVGGDEQGGFVRSEMAALGVDVEYVREHSSEGTSVAVVMVAPGGVNMIVVYQGANRLMAKSAVEEFLNGRPRADMLLLQPEMEPDVLLHAAALAKARGVRVVLNNAPFTPLLPELPALLDLLVVNEAEAGAMVDLSVSDLSSAETAARRLLRKGFSRVIITLGAGGSVLAETESPDFHWARAIPVTAVDSTAAGDAYIGALAARWAEGVDIRAAMAWGTAAAALCVTRQGSMRALPSRDEVAALLTRNQPG